MKPYKYKRLVVGLILVIVVSCVTALTLALVASSQGDQASSTKPDATYVGESPERTQVAVNPEPQAKLLRSSGHSKDVFRKKSNNKYGYSNEGTRFAIAFPIILGVGYTNDFECNIITREPTTVQFDSPYLGLDKTVILDSGGNHTESFSEIIRTTGGIEDKAIYVSASRNIIVQCAGSRTSYMDSFLALPYAEDDKEYYIAVCDDNTEGSSLPVGFVNVVATTNNTKVNFVCPAGVLECPAEEYTVDLDIYQTYSMYVYEHSDLSGFYISASDPVSVYTGSPYLWLYESGGGEPQFAMLSVPPRQQLGTLHYTPQTTGDPNRHHRLRVVATDTTTVSIPQYNVSQILQDREFYSHDYSNINMAVEVRCSPRCLVIHCNKEHRPDTRQVFMMRITPVEAYTDDILFSSASYFGYNINHYLSIIVNQYPVTDLYLDGNPLSGEDWTPTESGDHARLMLDVPSDLHHLTTTDESTQFSAYCHGNGGSETRYGYGSQAGVGDATYVGETPDLRQVPGYRINLWGNFTSLSGEEFDRDCGSDYTVELGKKADSMIPIVNDLLGNQLCSNLEEEDIVVISNSNLLTTSGPNGQTWVAFNLKVDRELSFEEVHDCGAEVTTFLMDHDNWGNPLLPPIDGCPFPVFDPPRFYDDGSEWLCADTLKEDHTPANAPDIPGYDFTIESNFTTFSGEDLSVDCATRYIAELDAETAEMFIVLNSRLGSSLCQGTTFQILTWSSMLYYQGSEGDATVKYGMKGESNQRLEEVFDCIDDILPFVLDHVNWGIPLLPQLPGCPLLVFHQQRFYEKEQTWSCEL